MDYVLHLVVFVLLYGLVALSLNVASGFTQLISLAHAGFFGVGAYATAILSTRGGWPLWVNLPLGMAAAGLVAVPVGLVALRTVEDYFIICTMGMGVILFSVMNNWMDLTRGPLGIPGIPPVSFFGHELTAKWEWVLLAGVFYAAVLWVARNLKRSALGRILVAISEDEIFCQSLGKNVGLAKLQSFVLGAMLAAVPGALSAPFRRHRLWHAAGDSCGNLRPRRMRYSGGSLAAGGSCSTAVIAFFSSSPVSDLRAFASSMERSLVNENTVRGFSPGDLAARRALERLVLDGHVAGSFSAPKSPSPG